MKAHIDYIVVKSKTREDHDLDTLEVSIGKNEWKIGDKKWSERGLSYEGIFALH